MKEQAAIARKLDISKSNVNSGVIETQTVSTETGIITNLKTEVPYYTRGYEMIEKEIDLIQKRENKEAFVDGLNSLYQKMKLLTENKNIERLRVLFNELPIIKSNGFSVAKIKTETTTFESSKENNIKLKTLVAALLGFLFSILYILIITFYQKKLSSVLITD